ncbi:DUF2975 domain-containing protein [Irregularibacter muris]|uniref:DUF2975 domain-containing protein n=1 Tax=Irregularibacter muris TaxID=1796619 RepID=A0AAE3HIP2_9FIRM|nr:DUF2975 domain-containing protein [Irregularibacter muris]MCR1899644.1 DUF2975 domain-containing protein [Irregularibacter muris]
MQKWEINTLRISIILIGMAILLIFILWLPDIAKFSAVEYPEYAHLRYPILIGLYITGAPFYLGIFHTFKLLKLIERDGAFTEEACKSLGAINLYAIIVILLYISGMIFLLLNNALHPGLFLVGLGIMLVAFIISVFAAILKGLLMKVVEIKNENDYTI